MDRFHYSILLTVILAVTLLAVACGGSSPAPTATATATTPAGPTMGQLAEAGKTVFANRCSCHGAQGQGVTGPAIIGPNASLAKYNTAQGLLNFISTTMPLNAPGSLAAQQYSELLSFLLVQNSFATTSTPFNQNQLDNVTLKK